MKNKEPDYWAKRYREKSTPWDIGYVSTPIKHYINQLTNKDLKILIPGAGNSYEAEYLFLKGFKNVYVVDIAEEPLKNLQKRIPAFPTKNLICTDFFELQDNFDLILEQTFFCALDPVRRPAYAKKMYELLNSNGKLAGLLFNFELKPEGPPFGGDKQEYLEYFTKYFEIQVLEESRNSIAERKGKELFFIFKKI